MSKFIIEHRKSDRIYNSVNDAIKAVNDISDAYDGEIVLSRYSDDGVVKSIMAVCHKDGNGSYNWTFVLDTDLSDYYTKEEVDSKIVNLDIVQTTGTSETSIMSQKAVTDSLVKMWKGTESEYEKLTEYDDNTIYVILKE